MQLPEQEFVLEGQRLQFPANVNTPRLGIAIKYYPEVSTPE
jgi:hypothetical protein